MREHPILFTGEMVRAILAGRKTQTRRAITSSNTIIDGQGRAMKTGPMAWANFDLGRAVVDSGPSAAGNPGPYLRAPNTATGTWHQLYPDLCVGDVMWVREACFESGGHGYYAADGIRKAAEKWWYSRPTCPGIHMPRWACRIELEVVGVRPERIQDIAPYDVLAEGITQDDSRGTPGDHPIEYFNDTCASVFRDLWDSINADRGFGMDANPWVWVKAFKRKESNR